MRPEIKIKDFSYDLPDERIAKYPLPERDQSKLLVYKEGKIDQDVFKNLASYIEGGPLMVFNDTKVVPARLFFRKKTGAHIEVFCLEPHMPSEYNASFAAVTSCEWGCVIGNAKKWKGDEEIYLSNPESDKFIDELALSAQMVSRDGANAIVRFRWNTGIPFSEVLEHCGKIPIPPYLNRESEESDYERYQTLYALHRGSVAAPTAGLHFTERVLESLKGNGVDIERVCLHVGAGTFMPVKSDLITGHKMHREPFRVSLEVLKKIADNAGRVVAVGTTSIRTLESLYYIGVNIIEGRPAGYVDQWAPYDNDWKYSTEEALNAIIKYLDDNGLDVITASTGIIIVPGFRFRIVNRLVTNFHQPQSTLLLLISAFVGGDWKRIYDYAMDNGFRFLSYGDSSLLFRHETKL